MTKQTPHMKIERKAMIRNRYNYPTLSVQDTKGKEERDKSNDITINALQVESQNDNFSPKNWPNGYPK